MRAQWTASIRKRTHSTKTAARGFEQVDQLFIDPVECIDCGACVPVCPVSAIFALGDLPEKWQSYIEKNSSYVEGGKFQPDKHRTA